MSKLKGLLLTEGMHGMISQVEGLAKALDIDYIHQKVELNLFAKLITPKITPVSNLFFKKFIVPEIDLIISCGRKSVIPSLYLKKNSKKKLINIHIQDPKVSLKNFDISSTSKFLVAPSALEPINLSDFSIVSSVVNLLESLCYEAFCLDYQPDIARTFLDLYLCLVTYLKH